VCKFSLEGSGELLRVALDCLINIKDFFIKKIDNAHFYLFTRRWQQEELANKVTDLTALQKCVMEWILENQGNVVGIGISYHGNRDLLDSFIHLKQNDVILLGPNDYGSGAWSQLSISFSHQSDLITIRSALRKEGLRKDHSSVCESVFHRLTALSSGA
jgi:hypothetical protein